MRIHRSGDKSVAFFTAYMNLLLQAEIVSRANLEDYMINQFFQNDLTSLGPTTYANFNEALRLTNKEMRNI